MVTTQAAVGPIPADPQMICELRDRSVGLEGWVVIDSMGRGGACGGIRIAEDVTLEEVMALARAMTLKYRFLDVVPLGGGKGGIVRPPGCTEDQLRQILEAFGRQAAPLLQQGIYRPWTDMNSGPAQLNAIRAAAGLPPRQWPESGYYTALSVVAALRAACDVSGRPVRGLTVALEGFGKVGGALARELDQLGATIVAVSTVKGARYDPRGLDVPHLLQLRSRAGADFITEAPGERLAREALLELPVDVLVPGARPWTIHAGNAGRIQARLIVPAANVPVTEDAKPVLAARGHQLLPDFACNAGGVLGSHLRTHGLADDAIRGVLLDDFRLRIAHMLHEAGRTGRSAEAVAIAHAGARRPAPQVGRPRSGALRRAVRGLAAPFQRRRRERDEVLRRARQRIRPAEASD